MSSALLKRYKTTAVFFLMAVAVGLAYFAYIRPTIQEQRLLREFEARFFRADQADISLIRIRSGKGSVDLARTPGGWMVAGKHRADSGAVERLFEAISGGRIIKVVGETADRKRFGFDEPIVILVMGFRDRVDELEVADENPSGTGHYAYARSLGKIFLVDSDFTRELMLGSFELREKRLFVHDPAGISRINIERQANNLDISLESDGNWRVTGSLTGVASRRDVEGFITRITNQRADGFVDWEDEYAKLPKGMRIKLYGEKGSLIDAANVYYWGTEWNRGILVHRPGSSEAARTRREFWNFLNSDASDFLNRDLFNVDPERVSSIRVKWTEGEYAARRTDSGWTAGGRAVSGLKVRELLEKLSVWRARKLIDESRFPGKIQFDVLVETDGRTQRLEVSNFNMDREVSRTSLAAAAEPGGKREKVDFWLARSSELDYAAIVNSLELKSILRTIEGGGDG